MVIPVLKALTPGPSDKETLSNTLQTLYLTIYVSTSILQLHFSSVHTIMHINFNETIFDST